MQISSNDSCAQKLRIYFVLIVCLHAVDIHVTRKEIERLAGTGITPTRENGSTESEARGWTVRTTSHDTLTRRSASYRVCDGARWLRDNVYTPGLSRRTRRNASRKMNAIAKLETAESRWCCPNERLCELFDRVERTISSEPGASRR